MDNSVVFPALNAVQEAKVKRLLEQIGEFMDVEITTESVVSMKASYPGERSDVDVILKRLAKKQPVTNHKEKAETK